MLAMAIKPRCAALTASSLKLKSSEMEIGGAGFLTISLCCNQSDCVLETAIRACAFYQYKGNHCK